MRLVTDFYKLKMQLLIQKWSLSRLLYLLKPVIDRPSIPVTGLSMIVQVLTIMQSIHVCVSVKICHYFVLYKYLYACNVRLFYNELRNCFMYNRL